jgi:hypothetical protein
VGQRLGNVPPASRRREAGGTSSSELGLPPGDRVVERLREPYLWLPTGRGVEILVAAPQVHHLVCAHEFRVDLCSTSIGAIARATAATRSAVADDTPQQTL